MHAVALRAASKQDVVIGSLSVTAKPCSSCSKQCRLYAWLLTKSCRQN